MPINFGTFGAFIRIKAPIQSKRQLFDVGVAGPIAGFVALIPFLLYGIAQSRPVPGTTGTGAMDLLLPGHCLAIQLATRLFHGRLAAGTVLNLHPAAFAAWLGLFATSLNLLPLGQLDGGHILYAATGRLQRRLALPFWLALALLGFYWPGWLLWCVIVLVIGLRHPPVYDESLPLDRKRQALAWVALADLRALVHAGADRLREVLEVRHQRHRPVVDQGHLHRGAEAAGRHLEAAAAEVLDQGVDQRLRLLGRGGAVEGGAAAAGHRAGEGELGDDQEGPADGGGVEVHPAGVVLEDPQAGELAGRGAHRLRAVAALDSHQHEEAAADLADRLAGHFHRRRAHPLYDEAHF